MLATFVVVAKRTERKAPEDLEGRVLRDGELMLLSFTRRGSASLTEMECRVARAMTLGLSNAEIARAHGVSVRTIANQVASILKKLGLSSRGEVAATFDIADMK